MWPFFLIHTHETVRKLRVSPKAVLNLLHGDPERFFRLSPLVASVAKNADPHSYTIVETIPVLGLMAQTTFTVIVRVVKDGVENDIVAGLGTRSKNAFHVRKSSEDDTCELVHHTTTRGLFLLMWYIVRTQMNGHELFRDKLQLALEGESCRQRDDGSPRESTRVFSERNTLYTLLFIFLILLLALKVIPVMNQSFAFTALGIFMGLALLGLLKFAAQSKDPYDLFHLTLNKRPGDQSTIPSTEWLNVGYWKDTDIFPDACRGMVQRALKGNGILIVIALALKLNQAAKRREGDSVLDVGHGTGESLVFMLTDPAVPRPSRIVGITSLPLHHQRTKDRVATLQDSRTQVDLYLGDAVFRPSSTEHPLAPQSDTLFDCVLALDCAYHFDTRQVFLSQSLAKLVAGGKIALADMCFEPRYQWLVWLTAKLGIVPKENVVTIEEYALAMKKAGFIDIEMENFTSAVLPKFLLFLRGVGPQWWLFSMTYGWYLSAMGVKFVLASGSRPGVGT